MNTPKSVTSLHQSSEENPSVKELLDLFFQQPLVKQKHLLLEDIESFLAGISVDEDLLKDISLRDGLTWKSVYKHFINNAFVAFFIPHQKAHVLYLEYIKFKNDFLSLSYAQQTLFTRKVLELFVNLTNLQNYSSDDFVLAYPEGRNFQIFRHEIALLKKGFSKTES